MKKAQMLLVIDNLQSQLNELRAGLTPSEKIAVAPAPKTPQFSIPAPTSSPTATAKKRGRKSKAEIRQAHLETLQGAFAQWKESKTKETKNLVDTLYTLPEELREELWTELVNSLDKRTQTKLNEKLNG